MEHKLERGLTHDEAAAKSKLGKQKPLEEGNSFSEHAVLPALNENLFVNTFLPLLVSYLQGKDDSGKARWVEEVATNTLLRVNVVSNDDHDEVLFYVPPMSYSPKAASYNGLGNLVKLTKVAEERQLGSAMPSYLKTMSSIIDNVEVPEVDIIQWQAILMYYGYIKTEETTATSAIEQSNISDEEDL